MKKKLLKKLMNKKIYRALLLGIAGCCSAAAIGAYAYLSDSMTITNKLTPETETTTVGESFPDPPPVVIGDSGEIEKKVVIENEEGVPCYVRALVRYSTTDFGTCSIKGMSEKWVNGGDGYYYYTEVMEEGESTEQLMTSVHVEAETAAECSAELDSIDIIVSEESYQAKDPETQELRTWEEAWKEAEGGNLK